MGLILEARSPTILSESGSGSRDTLPQTLIGRLNVSRGCGRLGRTGQVPCGEGCSGDDEQIIESSTEALRRP